MELIRYRRVENYMALQCFFTKEQLEKMDNRELLFEYRTIIQEVEEYKGRLKNIDAMMKLVDYRQLIGELILERMEK